MSTVTVPSNWDVSTLNEFIAQQESFLRGQLVRIFNEGDITYLEFDDREGKRPETNTIVTTGKPPPDARVVGEVRTFANGTPAIGTAFRK